MVAVDFVDTNFGLWGFIATVAFRRELGEPPVRSGADQILEVSVQCNVLDCNGGQILRAGPPDTNYGPLVENFGDGEWTIYDFHRFFGRALTGAYAQGEGLQIRVAGKTWIQQALSADPAREDPAFTVITPKFDGGAANPPCHDG